MPHGFAICPEDKEENEHFSRATEEHSLCTPDGLGKRKKNINDVRRCS